MLNQCLTWLTLSMSKIPYQDMQILQIFSYAICSWGMLYLSRPPYFDIWFCHFFRGPWGARSPIPENNAIAISKQVNTFSLYEEDNKQNILLCAGCLHSYRRMLDFLFFWGVMIVSSMLLSIRMDLFSQQRVMHVLIAGMWYVFSWGKNMMYLIEMKYVSS
jgi:hypothetical protein